MRRLRCKECNDFDLFDNEEDAIDEGWIKKDKRWICPDCQEGDGGDYTIHHDDDDDDDNDRGFGLGSGGFSGGSFGGAGGIG